MTRRRTLALIAAGALTLAGAVALTLVALPEIVRRAAIARLEASTRREASIDAVELSLLTGRLAVRGLTLADRDGAGPLARLERLEGRITRRALLALHLRFEELTLAGAALNVVRTGPRALNVSDLLGAAGGPGPVALTVDHLALTGGSLSFEDRTVAPPRRWVAERVALQARDLSTRGTAGRAAGSLTVAGAAVSLAVEDLRLVPLALRARVTLRGLDLSSLGVYLPAGAAVTLDRAVASGTVTVRLDPARGARADADLTVADLVLRRRAGRPPALTARAVTLTARDLGLWPGPGTGAGIALPLVDLLARADRVLVLDGWPQPPQ